MFLLVFSITGTSDDYLDDVSGVYINKDFTGKSVLKLKKKGVFIMKGTIPKDGGRFKNKGTWKLEINSKNDTMVTLFYKQSGTSFLFKKESNKLIHLETGVPYLKK